MQWPLITRRVVLMAKRKPFGFILLSFSSFSFSIYLSVSLSLSFSFSFSSLYIYTWLFLFNYLSVYKHICIIYNISLFIRISLYKVYVHIVHPLQQIQINSKVRILHYLCNLYVCAVQICIVCQKEKRETQRK